MSQQYTQINDISRIALLIFEMSTPQTAGDSITLAFKACRSKTTHYSIPSSTSGDPPASNPQTEHPPHESTSPLLTATSINQLPAAAPSSAIDRRELVPRRSTLRSHRPERQRRGAAEHAIRSRSPASVAAGVSKIAESLCAGVVVVWCRFALSAELTANSSTSLDS